MNSSLLIVVFLLSGPRLALSDGHCLYGWRLSDDRHSCLLNCDDAGGTSASNVYCQSAPMQDPYITYDSTHNTLSMPAGHSLAPKNAFFPNCQVANLVGGHYNIASGQDLKIGRYYFFPIYHVINDTSICYPLSPQLLQCDIVQTRYGDYVIEDGVTIVIPSRNFTAYLGDFYIADNGSAFTCSESVNVSLYDAPRCNYVAMNLDDYVIADDGSMFIPIAGFTVKNPLYSIVTDDFILVCFPLTFKFINCPGKVLNFAGSYIFNRDMSATIFDYWTVSKPDEYYVNDNGQLTQCDRVVIKLTIPKIVYDVYMGLGLLSVVFLFVTIILRYKLFVLNDHTRCMLNHILCLIGANVSLASNDFYAVRGGWPSYLLFTLYYYFSLVASLWLNVIAFDLWRFFSRVNSQPQFRRTSGGSNSKKVVVHGCYRFFIYNLYCWGAGMLFTTVTLIIDLSPRLCQHVSFGLCPHINHYGWFNNVDALVLYFYLPFNIMTVANLVFFMLIIRAVHRASCGTEMVNHKRRRQLFRVSMRLFILTGFCYMIVLICTVTIAIDNTYSMYTWYPMTGVLNLQGIVIFIIYYSGRETLQFFKRLRGCLQARLANDEITSTSGTSHTYVV